MAVYVAMAFLWSSCMVITPTVHLSSEVSQDPFFTYVMIRGSSICLCVCGGVLHIHIYIYFSPTHYALMCHCTCHLLHQLQREMLIYLS